MAMPATRLVAVMLALCGIAAAGEQALETSMTILAFDRSGKPAAGAEADVRFSVLPPGAKLPTVKKVTIRADGSAHIGGLTPGDTGLEFRWRGLFDVAENRPVGLFHLEPGANAVFCRLTRPGTAVLRVQDADGAPAKGARVYAFPLFTDLNPELLDLQLAAAQQSAAGRVTADTGADGVAQLDLVEAPYRWAVLCDGYRPCLAGAFRVHEGETVQPPPAVLASTPKQGHTITCCHFPRWWLGWSP